MLLCNSDSHVTAAKKMPYTFGLLSQSDSEWPTKSVSGEMQTREEEVEPRRGYCVSSEGIDNGSGCASFVLRVSSAVGEERESQSPDAIKQEINKQALCGAAVKSLQNYCVITDNTLKIPLTNKCDHRLYRWFKNILMEIKVRRQIL